MNRRVLIAGLVVALPLVGLLFASLGRDPHKVDSPLIGQRAPAFALPPLGGGEPISLAALRGRPVVLNFWATWCVPCVEEHPALTQGARALGSDVQFLGVVYQDEADNARRFLEQRGASYPSLLDDGGRTAIAYGVYGVPETFFISPDGTIVSKYVGPLSGRVLRSLIEKAAGAPQVPAR